MVNENERVRHFAAALQAGDLTAAGELMVASHHSLRDLYEVSTPVMDAAVEHLAAQPGVYGARMTAVGSADVWSPSRSRAPSPTVGSFAPSRRRSSRREIEER